jgi:SET domain-containing protein
MIFDPIVNVTSEFSMPFHASDYIEVKRISGKGRGVFACRHINAGTVFEKVPVIVMPAEEVLESTECPVLANYVFDWGKNTVALALGYGSIYNHSYSPNARYDDEGRQTKIFTALRDIDAGEEITVNYNGHEKDLTPVGFDVIDPIPVSPYEDPDDRLSRLGETVQIAAS